MAPQGWFNVVDFPPEWKATNTDTTANAGAGHAHWVALSATHKAALAQSIRETANYLEWSLLQFGVHSSLGSVSHQQSTGARRGNQDEISLQ